MKKYKADNPEHTISRILNIINTLHIPIREDTFGDGETFCSCRISITRDDDTSIGTNGKGMNRMYARASGYAEFMERFQNRVIVYPNPASIGSLCRFFSDEKRYIWNHAQAVENIKKYVPNVFPPEGLHADLVEGVSLPFYHVNKSQVTDIPYSLIRWINGSNGMCAGNIREEALIQGFCEIFERYAIQEMYRRKITPPDVPIEYFQGTQVHQRLEVLRNEYHMEYRIKDYSLGEGFPVIGLLLYSPDKAKYIMHLGSDLNPVVALERCFTEIFQGYTANTLTFENDVNSCERLDLFNEFKRSLMHGRGRLYDSFFKEKPSYEYQGHTSIPIGENFREDLHNICNWLIEKGYDIYIRDNSFLSFPALHVVIPGMSEINYTFCNLNRRVCHMQLTENGFNPLFHLGTLNEEECLKIIQFLEQINDDGIDLFPQNTNPNNHVNRHLILMLLYVVSGNLEMAAKCIEEYKNNQLSYGKDVRPYVDYVLRMIRGERIDEEIVSKDCMIAKALLAHPQNALKLIASPTCFDCENCPVKQGCRYPLLQEIENIAQNEMTQNIINQQTLSELF